MTTVPVDGDRFAALILAAGSARRFGGGKLTATFEGRPLLHHAIAAAQAAPVGSIVLVTGAEADAVAACARAFDSTVKVVHAAGHAEGMAASLRTGIAALPASVRAVFVFLGDMPRIPTAILQPLADAMRKGATAAAPTFGGRRGNPVVLSRALFPAVAKLQGDMGARPILDALGPRLALAPAPDDGVLFDIDKPGDLDRSGARP